MYCTYLNNDKSSERNLIWRCDENGFGGIFVYTIPDTFWTDSRRECFERDKENIVEFPSAFYSELLSTEEGHATDWKKRYFESIPFKISNNGELLAVPLIDSASLGIIYLQTVDSVRKNYIDVYAYDEEHQELFNHIKTAWNEAKEYIRTMADIIWAGKE